MFYRLLLSLFVATTLLSCESTPQYELLFCDELDANENCITYDSIFPRNTRVFVRLLCDQPLPDTMYRGTITVVRDNGGKDELGAERFFPEPGDEAVKYYLPFERFNTVGTYEITFTGSDFDVPLISRTVRTVN